MLSFDSRAAQDRIERLPWVERASIERVSRIGSRCTSASARRLPSGACGDTPCPHRQDRPRARRRAAGRDARRCRAWPAKVPRPRPARLMRSAGQPARARRAGSMLAERDRRAPLDAAAGRRRHHRAAGGRVRREALARGRALPAARRARDRARSTCRVPGAHAGARAGAARQRQDLRPEREWRPAASEQALELADVRRVSERAGRPRISSGCWTSAPARPSASSSAVPQVQPAVQPQAVGRAGAGYRRVQPSRGLKSGTSSFELRRGRAGGARSRGAGRARGRHESVEDVLLAVACGRLKSSTFTADTRDRGTRGRRRRHRAADGGGAQARRARRAHARCT